MNNELVSQPSWWKRNWKWVVPVGGCFVLIIGAILLVASLYFGVSKVMEDSQPYEYALELINNDEQLLEVLGSPIEKDGMFQGNISWKNGDKNAKIIVPITRIQKEKVNYILMLPAKGILGFIMKFELK